MTKIFIDPGHGGPDPGAVGNGVTEEYVNLNVSLELARLLREAGFDVKIYRTTSDENVLQNKNADLSNRAQTANKWGADYFISIHTNSSENPSAQGVEAYVYRLGGASERLAKSITKAVSEELGVHLNTVRYRLDQLKNLFEIDLETERTEIFLSCIAAEYLNS